MSRQIVPRRVSGVHRRAGQPLEDETTVVASALFDQYCAANTFAAITSTFQQMCDVLELMPSDHQTFYQSLKERLTSWKAQSLWAKLDKRAQQREYKKGRQCFNTRCLIIGGGPCGLRVAIEIALLGGKAVVVEKRDRFSRNNVLHLWPFLIHDLKALGAKKFFGKFCTGAVDHISIRTLQCILLKVALLLGVEIHAGVSFDELAEPPPDQGNEKIGWRAIVTPRDHPLSEYEFDVLVGADGKRNTLKGFKRKEFRGKLAIAITANFINRNTNAEACVEEISGVAFIFNQKFFKDLNEKTGIDLENIVYYKDETHYFVMTAKKHSLLHKGVLINDYMDTARLLSQNNVNQQALLSYACEAADVSTRQQLPHLDYAHNHYGQPDVAMFDFTSIYAAEHATRVIERNGYKLLMGLCGDSLIEPFWPTGSGCARGFLGALDLAATIKNWASARYTPLEVMAQRESVYQLLSQTTPENLSKNFGQYTMDPQTRYPNVNLNHFKPAQVVHQYDCTEAEFLDEIVQISDQKSKKYEWIRDSLYLQKWFGRQLESYGTIVKITDLEASWRNGLALCALIHKYRPELIGDIYKLDPNEVANNNQLAFDVAEKELGITPVMTGVDMAACEVPDKLTLVSYLSQFYEFFRKESIPTRPPVKIAKSPAQLPLPPRRIPQARSPAQRQTFLTRVNNRMRARKLGLLYRQYQAWSSSEDILDRYAIPEEEQKENAERHLTQGHIRKRGHAEEDPDNIVLQGYSRFEGRHVNEPATKLTRQGDTARLSATPRTRNKVTQLARGLAHKLRGDPTVPQEKKKPLIIKQQIPSRSAVMGKAPPSADVCYFCQKRVYVVERHSAEGVFFHRGCLKCDFCSTNLRIGQYGFKRGDNGQAKFYCTQHIGLERPMRRSRKRSYDDKELRAQLAAVEDSDEDLPYGETDGAVGGPLDKTPERIEYYTESEVEESELEQTQHNLSGSLLDIGVQGSASDSDESSSDELEWSDDAELSGAEGEWAQFATAYNKLNRLHKPSAELQERRAARRAARLKQRTAGSGSDTETPGSSDDWESESETEKESEGEESDEDRFRSVRQDDGPPPVMPAQAREFSDEYEEEPRSPRSPLGQQLSPIDYEDKHPSPAATSILKNRLSFFSAVSEPVRIDPFSFLGLSPAPNIAQGEKQLEQESEQEPEQVPELKEAEAEKAEEELAEKVYKEGDEEEEEEETESSLSETDTMTEGSESEEDKMGVVKKVHHPIPTISIEEVDMVELRSDDNEVGELPLDNDARVVCVTPQYEDSIRQDDGPPATEPEYRDFSDEFEEDECADLQQQPAGEADVTTPAQGSEESVQREATAVEIAEQEISVPSPVRITTERVPEVEAEQFEEAESDTPAQAEQVHEDSQGDEAARTELVPQVAGSDGEVSVMRNDEALRKELDLMELEVEAMKRSVGDRIAELAKVTALEETEMPPPVEEEPLVGDPGMVLLTAQALENVPPVVEENLETFATSDIVPSDGQQVASEPLAVFVKDVCITESTTDSAIDSLIEMDVCATEPTIESATDFNILVGPCATEPTTESTADFTILAGVCTTESTTNPTSDSLILTDVCPTDSTTDSSILTGVCTSESTTDESVPSLTDVLSSVSDVARSEDLSATCPSFKAQFKELSAAIDESQNVGVMHVAEQTNLTSETDSNSLVSADTIGSESRSNGSSAKRPTDLLTDSSDLSALKLRTALEKEMRRQNKIATKNSVHRTSSSELESFENIEALLKHGGEDQGTDIEADRLSSPLDEDTPKAELQMKAAPVAAMSSVVPSEDDLGPLSSVGPSERPSEDDLAAQGMAPIASIQEMFADMESPLDDLTPVLAEGANVESWVSAVLSESDHLETLQEPLTNAGTVAPGPAETGDNSSSSPTLTNNNSDEASDAALKSKQSIEDPRESSEISQTILEVKASTSLKPVSKEEVAVVGNAEKEDFLPTSVSADSLLPKHRPRPLRKDISLPSGNQTLNLKEQMLLERQQARKKEEKLKAKQATKKEPKVSVNRKEETKRKTPTMSLKESESRLTKSLRESESKLRRQLSAPESQIAKILEVKKHEENEKRKQPIFIKPPKKKSFDIPQDVPIAMAAAAAARARLTGRPISHDVKSKKQREEEVTKRLKEEHMKAKQAKKAEMERQDEARKKQREEDARRKRLQDEQRERDMEEARKKKEIELRRMREQKRTSKPVQIEKLDSWKQADAIKRIDTLLENLRGQPQTKGDTLKNLQKRQSEEIGILAQKLMSVEYRPGFENEMTPEKVASPSEKLEPTTEVILSIERGGGDAYPEKVYNIDDKFITSRDRRKRIRNLSNQSDSSITNVTNTTISTPSGSVRSISSVSEIFTANSIGISAGDSGSLDLLATTSESLGENISLDGLLDQDKDQLEETKNLIRPKSAGNVEELKQAVRPKSAQAALSVSIVDTSKADDSSMHTAESSLSESRSTNTTADESRYFTPNVSGLEVLDTSETSSNKCIQPADATSNTSSDRKSVDSLDTERSNSPLSPGKVTDAKRKFFCELPQPVCIDPKKIFRDLRSPQGKGKTLKDSLDKKEKRTHERDDTVAKGKEWKSMDAGMSRKAGGLDLRKDWQSMDSSTTPLSPTAGVPKTNLVNGEAEANVFYTPVSIIKTKADEPPQHRPHTEPTAKKRMLPPTKEEQESKPSEVEKGRREAEREKARQDARQRAKMLTDEELGIEEKSQKKPVITRSDSQPEATMYATKDMQPQPSASRTQPNPLSPQVQKVEGGRVPQHDRVGSDSSSRSTNSHPSEASTFGSSDRHRAAFSDGISDHSENSPAQSRKLINEKTKSLDRDKTKRRTLDTPTLDEAKDKGSGKKEKRRSFLAMLLPKKDKSKDKSTNVKSPKEDKKLKKTPEAKKSVLRLRTKLKMPKAAEKEKEMNRSSTYADEFNPFFEDAYGMEEKQKLKEKLDHVAPAATLTPTASRVAPKATVEEFDTESEFGDDRISVHSFRAQMLTEEDRAKAVKKQQKAAVRRQREQELKRLRMAQEIQRQLEEVEIKQRQVEMRGIALERALRGEGPDASRNEADLMQEWFNVVHEKNMLVRYESELMVHARELELEDRHSRLEQQLRDRMSISETEMTPAQKEEEQRILEELLEVVEQRDSLVALLEEDRLRLREEEKKRKTEILNR